MPPSGTPPGRQRRRRQLSYAATAAATVAAPAADLCANLKTQVHGGIAITWEHDAHLFLRRATMLAPLHRCREGVERGPPRPGPPGRESGPRPSSCRPRPSRSVTRCAPSPRSIKDLSAEQTTRQADRDRLRLSRPGRKPFGRARRCHRAARHRAGVRQRRDRRGRSYGITAWNILTIIQHGNQGSDRPVGGSRRCDQRGRVVPALLRARRRGRMRPA